MLLFLRTAQLGVKSLLMHPLRSLLTVLGIFIGTASVIWLLAIGEGISRKAQEQIEGLGADNVIVRSVKPPSELTASIRGPLPYGLTREEYALLEETLDAVEIAIPIREVRRKFRTAGKEMSGRMVGCTPAYREVTRLEVQEGRFLNESDLKDEATFCVLAAEVADTLFPLENPIGQLVGIEQNYYEVVGVLKPRSPTAAVGGSLAAQNFSSDIYVPITTLWRRTGDMVVNFGGGTFEGEVVQLNQVTLRIADTDQVLETAEIVKETLAANHDRMKDVSVVAPLELLEQARTTKFMFMVMMGMIAAISLVVGGIGIMNIMLATVTERTREIGIRRALGAKRSDIVRQFLIETATLSAVGGATGVIGGLLCVPVVDFARLLLTELRPDLMAAVPELVRDVRPEIVLWSLPLAMGISVAVGVIFGLYPAIRAADMDPIEALRNE